MSKLKIDFGRFRLDEYFWVGRHDVPWLAPDSSFLIHMDEPELSQQYRELIEQVCSLPLSTRNRLETYLYGEYQDTIFDTRCGGLDVTPVVADPTRIWNVVSGPGIRIPATDQLSPNLLFAVTFECPWDPEHGLGIRFDKNCDPVELGGSCDFG